MAAAHAHPGADENEHRRAVAEGDQDIGGSGAAIHVAMLAGQVLAVVGDLAHPAAGAVDREMEDLLGDVAHPSDSRTCVLFGAGRSPLRHTLRGP